ANDSANVAGGKVGIVSTSAAAHGTVTVGSDGVTLKYMPNNGFQGTDTFTVTISGTVQVATVPRETLATVNGTPVFDGFGSALAAVPGTTDQFYSMTDRGPNVDAAPTTPLSSAIGTGDTQITVALSPAFPNTAAFGSFSIVINDGTANNSETVTA